MNIDNIKISNDYISKIIKNIEHNRIIISYYNRLHCETDMDSIVRKIERLDNCNKFWSMDKYELQKIKDYKKTNLCKDKFCNNCKKVKQASRMAKYIPELEKYKEVLYHMVLTVPNGSGQELENNLKKQFKAFRRLIRYLAEDKKIKGLDFARYGYAGAVRSLEVTFKADIYHPHLHVGIVLYGQIGEKKVKNTYSIDNYGNRQDKLFSDFEILIQKIWYLLYNDMKVTKKAIEELELGYSCSVDKFKENDFAELFKYMTKATNEEGSQLSYSNFKTLECVLYHVRQIQGYGCLYRIVDADMEDEVDSIYDELINELQKKETPAEVYQTPQELLIDKEYTLISRKSIYSILRQL